MVKRIGFIVFANNSGLGAQTRRLAQILKPDKVLIVDSSYFSDNKEQHFEWYKDFPSIISKGFPSNDDVLSFLDGLDVVFTCENPFNFNLVYWAHQRGIKVYCQVNYEFCENLSKPYLPVPDKFLMPSYWKIEDMQLRYGDKVSYLPPIMDIKEFEEVRAHNLYRDGKKRFLHIAGTVAHLDRNGTLDLLAAVKLCKGDFELVVKTQHPLEMEYQVDDPRVTYELTNTKTNAELYENFDALILPRRYGGLSLTTNEALMCGLPVIMTDISPNRELLPASWLVPSRRKEFFMSRSLISVYEADQEKLAERIDYFVENLNIGIKHQAVDIAMKNFSDSALRWKYLDLFNEGQAV